MNLERYAQIPTSSGTRFLFYAAELLNNYPYLTVFDSLVSRWRTIHIPYKINAFFNRQIKMGEV